MRVPLGLRGPFKGSPLILDPTFSVLSKDSTRLQGFWVRTEICIWVSPFSKLCFGISSFEV